MTIKKISYLLLFIFLNSPINLTASNSYFKRIYESFDRNILRPRLWQEAQDAAEQHKARQTRLEVKQTLKLINVANHEAGHVIQSIQYPSKFQDFKYVTRLQTNSFDSEIGEYILAGHMLIYPSAKKGNIYDTADLGRICLAGAAADLVSENKPLFSNDQDILTYLQQFKYRSDMIKSNKLIKSVKITYPQMDKDKVIATAFKQTYQNQVNQSNNRLKIVDKLMEKGTLSALDIYKLLNTYPCEKTHKNPLFTQLSHGKSKEERFYPSEKKYSEAIYKNGQLVNVRFYQEDGLQKPKYIVDQQKQALLLKTYTPNKITIKEHEMNGQPKIGPAQSKNYKYGYNNNLEYVGYKGDFNKAGRNRQGEMAELD